MEFLTSKSGLSIGHFCSKAEMRAWEEIFLLMMKYEMESPYNPLYSSIMNTMKVYNQEWEEPFVIGKSVSISLMKLENVQRGCLLALGETEFMRKEIVKQILDDVGFAISDFYQLNR